MRIKTERRVRPASTQWTALCLLIVVTAVSGFARVGADIPWTTYEAEAMKTTGAVLGPKYDPYLVETESSEQKCVKLVGGEFVEFTVTSDANAMVIRYSLPDSAGGDGTDSALELHVNGKLLRTMPLTSHYAWLYGRYPFSNQPQDGVPRNFYDEVRVTGLKIGSGDVVRIQKVNSGRAAYCIVDLVDLENAPAALAAPANALSVLTFGAGGKGETDDTEALKTCISAAREQGKSVWIPAGEYKITGDILVPSSITIQGAGMWHTTFIGDEKRYGQSARRVRFKLAGENIHLADFAILGKLNYRDDNEPNDGIVGAGCSKSSVSRLWIEHTKVGIWVYNGTHLLIDGCRFRNLLADGVNLCVGTSDNVIQNCTARGTGDDCFAMWPAASDQGFVGPAVAPGNNVIRRCTGQLAFLANGAAIYGGANNRIEDCLFTDMSAGCGILISTTFPTSDEERKIDNNFSGETRVIHCRLLRCGGYDHSWAWRGSLQICLDRRSISGLTIRDVEIQDSISDGLTIVAPGSTKGEGTLSNSLLENVRVDRFGMGAPSRHGLWIRNDVVGGVTLRNASISDIQNDSERFSLIRE